MKFTRTRTRTAAAATAALLGTTILGLFAAPSLAIADISPTSATIEVKAGETGTETKAVTVPRLPAKADIEIAIDTTGSMGGAIVQAKSQATSLVNSIQSTIPSANFSVVDFKDDLDGPAAEYNLRQPNTNSAAAVQSAINAMSAQGGGDLAEAQNLVLSKAATDDPALWRPGSRRFVVLITDAPPHDALNQGFPQCTGSGIRPDPHGLATDAVVAALKAQQTTLFAVTAATGNPSQDSCYAAIAAASFTGSTQVPLGTDLSTQITSLINAASATVNDVHLAVVPPNANASWISFAPASAGPVSTPATLNFTVNIAVPTGTAAGNYPFDIVALADGGDIGHQALTIKVPPSTTPVAVTKTCTPATALPGGTVNCAVTVTNSGPVAATGVYFVDTSDPNLTFNPVSPQAGFTCTITNSGHQLNCSQAISLPANSSATVNYTATLAADAGPGAGFPNTVTVTATNDSTPGDNTATFITHTPSCTIGNPNSTFPQVLIGTPGPDVICGGASADSLIGLGGDDIIFGGGGPDAITGGDGNDALFGGPGTDSIVGGPGIDTIDGGPDFDVCVPGNGEPTTRCP